MAYRHLSVGSFGQCSSWLGWCLHKGYEIWDYYNGKTMDVYQPVPALWRRWPLWQVNCEVEVLRRLRTVRNVGAGIYSLVSISLSVGEVFKAQTILDVIMEWKQSWIWRKLKIIGQVDLLIEDIEARLVLMLAVGSYIRELFPEANSCALVMECKVGQGRILGSILECSKDACAYRGE